MHYMTRKTIMNKKDIVFENATGVEKSFWKLGGKRTLWAKQSVYLGNQNRVFYSLFLS